MDIEAQTAPGISSPSSDTGSSSSNSPSGYHMRWSRLQKKVQVSNATGGLVSGSIAGLDPKTSKKDEVKIILDDVSGSASPGQVLGLMGPSGSGKTTLLNILSGRSSYDNGVISINGHRLDSQSRKRLMSKIAYVKQQDIFFEQLTVRDQLTYTALLRLPQALPKEQKIAEVDRVISLLRLNKVAQSPIMLCSGGEKKRVNVGTELLTDPMVLLLDECTSGLDSTSATALMKLLKELARSENKTVITSIHQPSSSVFRSFDKLMMLAEGHQVYFGKPVGSLAYLEEIALTCPPGYNAADHWMDLLVRDDLLEGDEDKKGDQGDEEKNINNALLKELSCRRFSVLQGTPPRDHLITSWDNDAIAREVDSETKDVTHVDKDGDGDSLKVHEIKKYNTNWTTQFAVLVHRSLKNSRSAIFTPLNLIKSAALGLVAGLLWFQLENTERTLNDRSSYFFFTMTYWVFDSMFNALTAFPEERGVILKERASASYRLSAYFFAKTLSDAPVRLLLPLFYMIISFWMAGVSPNFAVFVGSTSCTLLSVLAGEAMGLMIGAAVYDLQKALTLMTVYSLALMLLGGFFVENVPDFVNWARFLSPFKYAFSAAQQIVFDRNMPCDGSGALKEACGGRDTGFATPEQILEVLRVEGSLAFNTGMLFVLAIVPRYIAYLALRSKKSGDRE